MEGKLALVTGAGKGIGRVIALRLSAQGASVIVVARTMGDLEALRREAEEKRAGASVHCIAADLSSVEDCRRVGQEALAIGDVDLLVNNAGVSHLESFLEISVEKWEQTFAVNVRAVMVVSQAIARRMRDSKKGGAIVNISSVPSGLFGMPDRGAYCSSKGALNQLTRVMALELGPHGIRTNAVAPCPTMTPMGRAAWSDPQKSAPMLGRIPLQRFPEPEDVAAAVVWLLSDEARMVTGQLMCVDGGFSATGAAFVPLKE